MEQVRQSIDEMATTTDFEPTQYSPFALETTVFSSGVETSRASRT